jgi:hypothetical protein
MDEQGNITQYKNSYLLNSGFRDNAENIKEIVKD